MIAQAAHRRNGHSAAYGLLATRLVKARAGRAAAGDHERNAE